MLGCGGERLWLHVWEAWSQVWCLSVPSCMAYICSDTTDSCSTCCQHMWAKWFSLPQVEQVVPNAGQWILRWAVLSCSSCLCYLQYAHGPRPWLVAGLPWWLFPLAGVALLVGLPLVGLCWLVSAWGRFDVALFGSCAGRGGGRHCCLR